MNKAIGIFDSGVGGLTVMRRIRELLPYENICYFGDTARVPYGAKSAETIKRYALENSSFLMNHSIKVLVIACHTASALATSYLKEMIPIPVIDVIEPTIKDVIQQTKTARVAIVGTKGTIGSNIYQNSLKAALPEAAIFAMPCPMLVHCVEEQLFDHPATKLLIEEYVKPLKENNPDTLILGCTHYPLLGHLFQRSFGDHVTLVDPAISCAHQVKRYLSESGQINSGPQKGTSVFFVSDDAARFQTTGEYFFREPLERVELVKGM